MTPRVRSYVRQAAELFGTTPELVMSRSRKEVDVIARRAVWQALREDGFGVTAIGRMTGRDHTSVIHGLKLGIR